ncbi:hypothetical protein INR49_023718 [Caranx melampygus]|nr:hypothetical protein INR49_023718 [Caranx melampygus]
MQLGSWAAQHAERDKVSKDSRNEVMDSAASRGQQNPLLGCDNMDVISMETLERSVKTDQGVPNSQFRFSGPSEPLDNNPMYYEGTKTESMFNEETETKVDVTGTEVNDTEMPAQERLKATDLKFDMNELGDLGSQMEQCIEEAQQLQNRRKELLAEVLELRRNKNREEAEGSNKADEVTEEQIDTKVGELLTILKAEERARREERKKEVQSLREERAEEEKRMWKVNLERQGLQEELRKLKMRLFVMARDCTHSQASLNNQRREVELLRREEEKLQSLFLQLTEESCQLRSAQQQKVLQLQAELHAQASSQTSNTQEELTECRRHSCGDIQQYLQGGLKALEDRYLK